MRRFVARAAAYVIQGTPNDHADGAWENADLLRAFVQLEDFLLDVLDLLRHRAGAGAGARPLLLDPREADVCEWHDHVRRDVCPWGVRYAEEGCWEV